MKRMASRIIWIIVMLTVLAAAGFWLIRRGSGNVVSFRTEKVYRGELINSISATGTIEPEDVIDVGAQVAGQILAFGKDVNGREVDYGSTVDKGTVLAEIDDSVYASQAAEAEAQIQSAIANIRRSEADLEQSKARFVQAEQDWRRAESLGPSEAMSPVSYDGYKAAFETAKAGVAISEASILQAKAGLAQSEAVFQRARRNLGYCTIKSPVKGVIIDRRVNIGQTVVSSLNAPSLFLIAADLRRMQVWVAVNEADIGRLREGIPVSFTIDAFPGETFRGTVGKIRLNASMTQNVVTYTVEIETDNSNGRLLPYLTANVSFELDRRADVLIVPNAALRWKPGTEQIVPEFRDIVAKQSDQKEKKGRGGQSDGPAKSGRPDKKGPAMIWEVFKDKVKPIEVKAGISDGVMTEVEGEGLAEGQEIVSGIESSTAAAAGTAGGASNPFTPNFQALRGGRR